MSYESLGVNPDGVKGSWWKDASAGRNDVYSGTIAFTFGGAGEKKVTLTLANSTENTFYHKHVPRRGETPKKIHAAHADAARGVVGQIRDAVTN